MAAGQTYKGKQLRILADGKPIYHSTSCKLSVSTSIDEIETKDTEGTIVTPGNYSYTLSTDTLVAQGPQGATHLDTFDLLELQLAGTEITFQFANVGTSSSTPVAGTKLISGALVINNTDIDASVSGIATGAHSFTGNGNITISTVA